MVEVQSDTAKREGIALEIADCLARQQVIVLFNEGMRSKFANQQGFEAFNTIAGEDEKNLEILETVKIQHGIPAQPRASTLRVLDIARELLDNTGITLIEKLEMYGLLKHAQAGASRLVLRSAQTLPRDAFPALAMLGSVISDNRSHERQLMDLLDYWGVRELTGESPNAGGFVSRMKGVFQQAAGAVAGAAARPMEDMPITAVLKLDHTKASQLFKEIEREADTAQAYNLFVQLYKDLSAHAEAEEQTFYRPLQQLDGFQALIKDSYEEHAEMKRLLSEIRDIPPSSQDFKVRVGELRDLVEHHVQQEENDIFDLVDDRFDDNALRQMSLDFKNAKAAVQEQLATSPDFTRRAG